MSHTPGWETEFIKKGFSLATVAFFRNIAEVTQPGVISLDITELEALQHEFRLLRNTLDSLSDRIQGLELNFLTQTNTAHQDNDTELFYEKPNLDEIETRLNELEALLWQT